MKQDQNKRSWKHVAGDNVVKRIGSPWQSGMELLQQLHYTRLSVNTASFSCSSNSRWSERKTNIKPTLVPQNNLTVKNTESNQPFAGQVSYCCSMYAKCNALRAWSTCCSSQQLDHRALAERLNCRLNLQRLPHFCSMQIIHQALFDLNRPLTSKPK